MNSEQIPKLRRGLRLQFEPVQNRHVLLYAEGMVQLNQSAAEILLQIDGRQSIAAITQTLRERFPDADGIEQDISEFIETAHEKFWIELH